MELITQRIMNCDKEALSRKLAYWKFKSKKFTFIAGYFDVLNKANIEYLTAASDKADRLMVGVYSDKFAKANNRPLTNSEQDRALLLACLRFTNVIVILDEPAKDIAEFLQPDEEVEEKDF